MQGKENKYPISEIPVELLKDAKMIVRNSSSHFRIKSITGGSMEVTEAYTIMNNAGLQYSYFIKGYSKFMKIKNIKGIFYDEYGNVIKKLKKDELLDIPAISGFSLYEDKRVIVYKPDIESYPFTVEYTYTINFNGFLSYPSWEIYNDYNISVQKSEFKVSIPSDMAFRKYYQNLDIEPIVNNVDNISTYTWSIENYNSIKKEPFSPPFNNFAPILFFAPIDFKISGYEGTMETWSQFGDWISKLNRDRNNIPEESKIKIRSLVKDVKTEKEKIDILYKFMQDKTRYVNIVVGIGGWQPFESEVVDRLSYGDCKALSFYMKSLLQIVGIKSYYTIVKAGATADQILSDFPMNQFNHAFLCIPMQDDTTWLECTSQILPTGFLGDFTDDRDVLIIDGSNSKLIRSLKYNLEDNIQRRKVEFILNDKGEGVVKVKTQYHGLASNNMINKVDLPVEDNKKWLYENLEIRDFIIKDFSYSIEKKQMPELYENINLMVKNYASVMEDRLVVPLNLMNRIESVPKKIRERNTDVMIRRSSRKIDSIIYILPKNYDVDVIPEKVIISSKYGEYEAVCTVNEGKVLYLRRFDIYKGVYKLEEYSEFRNFLKKISKADKQKFVLKKV